MDMSQSYEMFHDALTVAIEEHALSVQHLLEEAFPNNPEVIAIYNERVAPSWSTFVEELVSRATSQSASAVVLFQKRNDQRLDDVEARVAALEAVGNALAHGT